MQQRLVQCNIILGSAGPTFGRESMHGEDRRKGSPLQTQTNTNVLGKAGLEGGGVPRTLQDGGEDGTSRGREWRGRLISPGKDYARTPCLKAIDLSCKIKSSGGIKK